MTNIRWLRACWECDGCGKDFAVEIDTGWSPPKDWDLVEIARDAIRHGRQVPLKGRSILEDSCSIQHDLVLCGDCTRIADSIGDENYRATKEEILREIS